MTTQLVLLDSGRSWKLDRRTREIGKRGVAQAREALRNAGTAPAPTDPGRGSRAA